MIKKISNNHWRPLYHYLELTESQQQQVKDNYNHDITDSTFFIYQDYIYSLDDFMAINNRVYNPVPQDYMKGYDGYLHDTYFSGILIKISDCNEAAQVTRFYS